jgi:hypothetical protein
MQLQCATDQFEFQGLGNRKIVASFDGGTITSDAGGLILREVDQRCKMLDSFSECFTDRRHRSYCDHDVRQMLAQRVYGICLGYEDLNDHDQLRYDPLFAALCEQEDVEGRGRKRTDDSGKALAGSSTLQRLESARGEGAEESRYHKIFCDEGKIERFFVQQFLAHYNGGKKPEQIIIDVDATDDPVHGTQEGRFFHGYYNCYCYLPLYIFCEGYLLAARLRPSNIDASLGTDTELERIVAQIRERWPQVRIIVRGDSGFAREWLMTWCEDNGVEYLFGLAKNNRLKKAIGTQMQQARLQYADTGEASRVYGELCYRTRKSWSRQRRVVGKAEYLCGGENPRFVVTSLDSHQWPAQILYEGLYCARGDMENRIKEQQLYLFADRTSAASMRANQLRLWFSSVAYVLMHQLREVGLRGTELENSQCHTIRTKVLKIGARVVTSTRRIVVHLASGYPYQDLFRRALLRIQAAYP